MIQQLHKEVFVRKVRQSASMAAKPFHISMLSPLEVEVHRVLGYTHILVRSTFVFLLRYDKIILVGVTQPHEMGHEWLLQSPNIQDIPFSQLSNKQKHS